MTPEQEKRLQEIEDRVRLVSRCGGDVLTDHAHSDIPWLIERLREAEANGRQRRRAFQGLPVKGKGKGDCTTDYEEQEEAE